MQSGTSALTALSQQGSQLLGVLGTGGAIAGAVLTVALLATQLATGGDAAKALNDALSATKSLYNDLNEAAERRTRGLSEEIASQIALRDYLAATTAEARAGIEVFTRLDTARRGAAVRGLLDDSVGGLGARLSRAAGEGGTPFVGTDLVPNLVDLPASRLTPELERLRQAREAIGDGTAITRRQVDELAGALDGVARSNGTFAREANTALVALERQREGLYAAAAAAEAAGRGIDETALAAARLARQVAAGNVGQELTAQVFAAQQVAAAFARGDVAGARRLTREQELDARARQLAEQAEQSSRRAFPAGTPESEIDAAVAARRDQIASDAARLARLERENRDREEAARNAEREAERAARAGERAGARDARRTQREAERELNDALRDRQSLLRSLETPYETYVRRLEELQQLQERLPENERLGNDQIQRAADRLQRDLEQAERGTQRVDETARDLSLTFSSAFEDAIVKGEDLRTVLKGIEADIARIIIRRGITEPLANAAGPLVKAGTDFITGLFAPSVPAGGGNPSIPFGGPRAAGGPVSPGSWYLVGERGPEPFIPAVPGQILPTDAMRGMGGATVVQTFNIDARGAESGVDARIRAGIGIAVEQANARLLAQINRGGSVAKQVGRRA